ncbi:MAG: hypothetical protein Kow0081_1570 [Candidatus Dojkabacteria bacterium]
MNQNKEELREIMKTKMVNKSLQEQLNWESSIYRKLLYSVSAYVVIFLTLAAESVDNAAIKALIPTVVLFLINAVVLRLIGVIFARFTQKT